MTASAATSSPVRRRHCILVGEQRVDLPWLELLTRGDHRDGDGPSSTIPSASRRNDNPYLSASSRAIAAVAGSAYYRKLAVGEYHCCFLPWCCSRIF